MFIPKKSPLPLDPVTAVIKSAIAVEVQKDQRVGRVPEGAGGGDAAGGDQEGELGGGKDQGFLEGLTRQGGPREVQEHKDPAPGRQDPERLQDVQDEEERLQGEVRAAEEDGGEEGEGGEDAQGGGVHADHVPGLHH